LASFSIVAGEEGTEIGGGLRAKGGISKFFTPDELAGIAGRAGAQEGDLLLFVADDYDRSCDILSRLRLLIGSRLGLRDPRQLAWCWVTDFPLFEWSAQSRRWTSMHHPFTMPNSEDFDLLMTSPGQVRAQAYDLVCNGYEAASGSVRIHRPDVQDQIFALLGIDEAQRDERFGHILEAFAYGPPPHAGIAPGIDRWTMLLTDDENIREVILFPKIGEGTDPLMGTPGPIDARQWAELGLRPS